MAMTSSNDAAGPELIWRPSSSSRKQPSRLTTFRKSIAAKHGVKLDTYADLWQWSYEHPSQFWEAVWDECEVVGDKGEGWAAGVNKGDALYPAPL